MIGYLRAGNAKSMCSDVLGESWPAGSLWRRKTQWPRPRARVVRRSQRMLRDCSTTPRVQDNLSEQNAQTRAHRALLRCLRCFTLEPFCSSLEARPRSVFLSTVAPIARASSATFSTTSDGCRWEDHAWSAKRRSKRTISMFRHQSRRSGRRKL